MEEKTTAVLQDEYNRRIEELREKEYPALKGSVVLYYNYKPTHSHWPGVTYLDHGGSTIPAKSLLDEVAADLSSNLYGNPHSACTPAELSGRRVDEIREQALRFFNADPEHFDLVFVANATAAMKLVMDAFKDHCDATRTLSRSQRRKFWYGYHRDAHNSLIGIREAASGGHHCFDTDAAVDAWIAGAAPATNARQHLRLFAYPGQSNMTGRRLPPTWPSLIRASPHTFTLLDAAALATTSPLPLHDPTTAPDFTTLSFYKIFGFPDLGALLIRRTPATAALLTSRRYFAGGTVDMTAPSPSTTSSRWAPR
ncbi:putative molybdenum cofactor sulfurase protein [Neofusicoccum parvum UCRNP2]|uniref:Putative molybdenum cofactor sulfurase protein n=1 Tax=Botryosphaeria parva (strain UCR-NP2) TaxID=1287680 RepID=R1G8V1_BOTPV|nr:putative molybdenum cofactor sulfurase protein [Neofusicoccum parvum UCRNP2]